MNLTADPVKLVEEFTEAFMTDDESPKKIGNVLLNIYERSDEKEMELIDYVFIALCGWSLTTLIKRAADHDQADED